MPDRFLIPLKVVCLGLIVLIVLQLPRLVVRSDPFRSLTLPSTLLPAKSAGENLSQKTNRPAATLPSAAPTPVNPQVQGKIDRIIQSEVFVPIFRPPPMALLGIAGKDAFIRAPNGQTGLLREGEELTGSGVKLLSIGINRVLIEHEGQKKELTIFAGFGSESLLPQTPRPSP